jgi:hypothetical protein
MEPLMKKLALLVLLVAPTAAAQIILPTGTAEVTRSGRSVTVRFQGWGPTDPMPPACYAASCVVVQAFDADFGRNLKIQRITSFYGVDQGNTFESHVEVHAEDGTRLYMRSPHKEIDRDHYDAWGYPWAFDNFKTRRLVVHLRAQNAHPTVRGRVHYELVLLVE